MNPEIKVITPCEKPHLMGNILLYSEKLFPSEESSVNGCRRTGITLLDGKISPSSGQASHMPITDGGSWGYWRTLQYFHPFVIYDLALFPLSV